MNSIADRLRDALHRDITAISFSDNSYLDEAFASKCVADGFAGWYDPDAVERQVDFVLQHCPILPGAKVLDAACGHGKHTELLARRGFGVLGVDVSSVIVAHLCQRNIDGAEFRCVPFGKMDFSNEFSLTIALGNSLALLRRSEFLHAVGQLVAALTVGGYLFVEMDNRQHFITQEAGGKTWSHFPDDQVTLSAHYYDPRERLEKTIDTTIDLRKGTVEQFLLTKSLYDAEELLNCLRQADLEIVSTFGSWNGSELTQGSPCILVASRRAF